MNNFKINTKMNKKNKERLTVSFNVFCDLLSLENVTLNIETSSYFPRGISGYSYSEKLAMVGRNTDCREMIYTMAHELRHCWQWKNNLLSHGAKGNLIWNGPALKSDFRNSSFKGEPWELDAINYENKVRRLI